MRYGSTTATAALCAALFVATCGCGSRAARSPRLISPPQGTAEDLESLLAAHPVPPGQNIAVARLGGGPEQSYHLIQIRDREAPHRHVTHAFAVTLLAGCGTLYVNGAARPMAAGDVAFVPPDTPHYFVNTGPKPAAAFVVFAPEYDGRDSVPEPD